MESYEDFDFMKLSKWNTVTDTEYCLLNTLYT